METTALEEEALHLPIRDRARLAHRLLESLDTLSEEDAKRLWDEEAQRRAAELDKGDVDPVSSDQLEQRVQAKLG